MNTEEIEKQFWGKFNIAYVHDKGFAGLGKEIIEFYRTHLTARYEQGRRDAREGNIKTVRNSRTLNEAYGIGKAEDAARTQVIVDIISTKEEEKI